MVEMTEASNILNNVSERSLVLFDELGRGTSTYDGISIAWAIVEYLHENTKAGHPRTLFATHYHELNEMEKNFSRIKNYNVSVKEVDGKVIFLRKLERGGSEHSFGIHVAEIAGMPRSIVKRANVILKQLEQDNAQVGTWWQTVGRDRRSTAARACSSPSSSSTTPCSVRCATRFWVSTSTTSRPWRPSTSSTTSRRLSRGNDVGAFLGVSVFTGVQFGVTGVADDSFIRVT